MADANVTRRELSLGARDATTGWPSKTYAETTIKGSFDPADARLVMLKVGAPLSDLPYLTHPFYTGNLVARGDHIVHPILSEVHLNLVKKIVYLNQFIMYACNAEIILVPADRAATSGTWHVDSDAIKTDPRNRIKAWIDAHISYSVCDYQIMFAGGDYPFEREFTLLGNEIVSVVDVEQSTPEYTADLGDGRKPYKFTETCTITNTTIDTVSLTATNILESFEQAIRDVATDHPLGSIRRISSSKPSRVNIGGAWLWTNTITIEYTRANDDYVPSYPTITWTTGTFVFPNVIGLRHRFGSDDDWMSPVNFSGSLTQALGSEPLEVELTCDLDVSPSALSWKRPQATPLSPTDAEPWDIFKDLIHNEGIAQDYHTISFGAAGPTFKVRCLNVQPNLSGDESRVTVTFREYREDSASDETFKVRFGITT